MQKRIPLYKWMVELNFAIFRLQNDEIYYLQYRTKKYIINYMNIKFEYEDKVGEGKRKRGNRIWNLSG